jgi:hypothetical protein
MFPSLKCFPKKFISDEFASRHGCSGSKLEELTVSTTKGMYSISGR